MQAVPATPAEVASRLIGYVEAIVDGQILGWAWDRANPRDRLTVRLSSGGQEVAEAVADQPRHDLQINGIGDGRHAFEFSLPSDIDAAQVEIVAIGRAGTLRLDSSPALAPPETTLGNLQSSISQMMDGQRLLYRNVQAILMTLRNPPAKTEEDAAPPAMTNLAGLQDTLKEQLAATEVFLVRIDRTLRDLHGATQTQGQRAGTDPLLIGVALVGAVCAAIAAATGVWSILG
jgi:hypothetical protein